MFDRKTQRKVGIVVAIVVSVAMLVTLIPGFSGIQAPQNSATADYDNWKSVVDSLKQQVDQSPDNVDLRLDLANAYYDLGVLASEAAPDAFEGYFAEAVTQYEEVLKTRADDVNILVDCATAAFYSANIDTAEKHFEKALEVDPDFYNGLLNYGIFLVNAKKDYDKAIAIWQGAVDRNPTGPNADQLKSLIAQVQELRLEAKLNEAEENK